MSAHTPGPWAWRGWSDRAVYLCSQTRNTPYVLRFERAGFYDTHPIFNSEDGLISAKDGLYVHEVPYRKNIVAIDHPDARLIAAAPELLAACEAAGSFITHHAPHIPGAGECVTTIIAAIQKALDS